LVGFGELAMSAEAINAWLWIGIWFTVSVTPYINDVVGGNMNPGTTGQNGGSQPHNNFQPYLCVDFIISLFGIFPSQT
jgi:microcystin-dependent protein